MAFRRFGRGALSRNATKCGACECPETPHRLCDGIIVALWNQGNQRKASALAPMLQVRLAHAVSSTKSIRLPTLPTPYNARRCCSYPPDKRGRRVWAGALFFMALHTKASWKRKDSKKAMGFAGGRAGRLDSGVRRVDCCLGTYETVGRIEKAGSIGATTCQLSNTVHVPPSCSPTPRRYFLCDD